MGLLSACSSAPRSFGDSGRNAENDVYEVLIRWFHQNYQPSQENGYPAAWCLSVGRFSPRAIDRFRRGEDERYQPSRRLLDRLSDLSPLVTGSYDCHQTEQMQELYQDANGPPAALLIIDLPEYEASGFARVLVRARENQVWDWVFDCRVERSNVDWRVQECIAANLE